MCREAKILLVVSAVFTMAMGLSNIFVNVFFWRKTGSFSVIALYNLMHYIFTPIFFFIGGWISKKKNGIWSLRIGLIVFVLFFILILNVGEDGKSYIYPLGMLYGMASGFYWLAFNTLSFDFTSLNNRDTFNGYNGSCAGIAAAISPITAAFIINRVGGIKGYNIVFSITLVLFLVILLISVFLRSDNYGSKLNLSKCIGRNCDEWSIIRKGTTLWGFRDVVIAFIVNILIIETTGNELSLGKLSFIAAILSSSSFVLVQRIIKPAKRILALYIGSIFSFIAVAVLFLKISFTTLLIYTVLDAFFIPFYLIQYNSSAYNVINRAHEEDMRTEYIINKDLALNLGRIISTIILIIVVSIFKDTRLLKYYLLFIGIAPVISAYFLSKLKKVLEGRT